MKTFRSTQLFKGFTFSSKRKSGKGRAFYRDAWGTNFRNRRKTNQSTYAGINAGY